MEDGPDKISLSSKGPISQEIGGLVKHPTGGVNAVIIGTLGCVDVVKGGDVAMTLLTNTLVVTTQFCAIGGTQNYQHINGSD